LPLEIGNTVRRSDLANREARMTRCEPELIRAR
jgi:hypothetical protein